MTNQPSKNKETAREITNEADDDHFDGRCYDPTSLESDILAILDRAYPSPSLDVAADIATARKAIDRAPNDYFSHGLRRDTLVRLCGALESARATQPGSWAWALLEMKAGKRIRLPDFYPNTWLETRTVTLTPQPRQLVLVKEGKVLREFPVLTEWFTRTDWQLA